MPEHHELMQRNKAAKGAARQAKTASEGRNARFEVSKAIVKELNEEKDGLGKGEQWKVFMPKKEDGVDEWSPDTVAAEDVGRAEEENVWTEEEGEGEASRGEAIASLFGSMLPGMYTGDD
jgi:hypothetical protein